MVDVLPKPERYAWWIRAIISKAVSVSRPGRDGRYRTRFAVIVHTGLAGRNRLLTEMAVLGDSSRFAASRSLGQAWWSIRVSDDETDEVEIIFLVRNSPDFREHLRGLELTGACLIDGPGFWGVRDRALIASKTGRYPSVLDGGQWGDSWVVTRDMVTAK